MQRILFAAATALSAAAFIVSPAEAVTLKYTADGPGGFGVGGVDGIYEAGANGLASVYTAPTYTPLVPLANGNYLVPLERAVGEVRVGRANNSERTRGLHDANAATGLPAPYGTGVTQALTNVNAIGGGSNAAITSGQSLDFTMARVGKKISYTVGSYSTGPVERDYFDQINAFQFRVRSQLAPTTGAGQVINGSSTVSINDIAFSDASVANFAIPNISASNGDVAIRLFDGVTGDFTITGKYVMSWAGTLTNNTAWRPTGSALSSQLKLLQVPTAITAAVPEPGTWAMMILGFGLIGAAARKRSAISTVAA